ncbi:Molybdate transport system regulatory protein [Sphingomonas sp. EC-HK361]|uniref:winged helix-turn-helix domain-containing protein n=1 Tax=Sphingomonas sp. EC-HK361 TaxID=2038397 RepID=UPI001252DBC4|nr:LysR family transcriptional regulator [Sphingomonas sp. EC-HK361]VVT08203.1 Molybdate transport system regulatory protein [Sphingomonas sp. EC-HK361]
MRVGALKLKLQLICGDSYAMGPGKADVLDAIDREGSISAAGRALGMSYRRIWLLVDEMNRCFAERLVETRAGGSRDRGAHLTDCGREVLAAFRDLEAQSAAITESAAYRELTRRVRETPLID